MGSFLAPKSVSMKISAIDIGTNSTRLLIAQAEEGKISKVLLREAIITRLGEKVNETKSLSPQAIKRTLKVLSRYRQTIDKFGVEKIRTVATSAVREASNAREFLSRIKKELALKVEILSGEEEAYISFKGAISDPRFSAEKFLVIDVGGGSTELTLGSQTNIDKFHSFDLGCVRLTETFLFHDPVLYEEIEGLRAHVYQQIKDVFDPRLLIDKEGLAIAVAGTPTSLVAIKFSLEVYDSQKVHGQKLYREEVENLLSLLFQVSLAERKKITGLEAERADVIIAGTAILAEIMGYFGLQGVVVSESDILDGLVLSVI